MGRPITLTYAPSEVVTEGLDLLGLQCEAPIVANYLDVTGGGRAL
jgi:hypothetical protein